MLADLGGPAWVPVGLSDDLAPGRVRATRVNGQPVALWRDADGAAHAWRDQCPHRGMRLSFGSVRDGQLACVYHGWRFAPDAQCVHVPADPAFTPAAALRATAYACTERDGWIWASLDAGADESAVPRTGVAPAGGALRSLVVRAAAEDVEEALGGSDAPGFVKLPLGGQAAVGAVQSLDEGSVSLHVQLAAPCQGAAAVVAHRALTALRNGWEVGFGGGSNRA